MTGRPLRVAILCDFLEERWPSMDLTGDMILEHLTREHADTIEAVRVRPTFRRVATRVPILGRRGAALNVDRVLNRYLVYPRALRRLVRDEAFDVYHLVDHSYAQLLHELPANRTVVTCHDLDTFRCLLDPVREPRAGWFRALTRRTLEGLKKAVFVACNSDKTRGELIQQGLFPESRLQTIYYGCHPECLREPDPVSVAEATRLLGPLRSSHEPDLLHVGSNIPRKRIDVLLETFARVRAARPGARLIKVGGVFNPPQAEHARRLGITDAILTIPFGSRTLLAAIYRRVDLVLQTSESEGFGLPVIEALASGAPVLASDLDVLREVAGEAACYCPVADLEVWTATALQVLDDARDRNDAWRLRRDAGLRQVERYSWSRHACQLVGIYQDLHRRAQLMMD